MKLLYDLSATQSTGSTKFHGGGEYAKTIFFELIKREKSDVSVFYYENFSLDERIEKILKNNHIKCFKLKRINELDLILLENEYDVLYSALPYSLYIISIPKNVQFIYTVHGLRNLEMPRDFYEYKYTRTFKSKLVYIYKYMFSRLYLKKRLSEFKKLISITSNSRIIVPSEHTRSSLMTFLSKSLIDNIDVLYSPKDYMYNKKYDEVIFNSLSINIKDYFLLISGDRWIKNNIRAVKALDKMYSKKMIENKKTLVLGVSDNKIYSFIKNKEKFVFKPYVEYYELENIIRGAFAFIYPSLNEGFGYPPLDAMKYGVPVIASSISAIPEICSNAVLYFNPYDTVEIENRVNQVLINDYLYNNLCSLGQQRFASIKSKQEEDLQKLVDILCQ